MTSPKNTSTASKTEKHEFGAEVGRLLDLVVHSLYSEREIFLRELLANAADASDKRRFEALTDAALSLPDEAPISVRVDLPEKKIEISDQGMGMSRDELVANLGTIARSGTRAFGEKLKEASVSERPSLIGQFGVGFYSAFMVADRVEVISRKAGAAEAWKWESDGKGAYELSRAERAVPGTDIILHVKENASEFLSPARLKEIAQKWTRHLSWPIDLEEPEEDGKPKKIRINEGSALWTRQKSKISQEEYEGFYRQLTHNFDKPADILHWRAEGVVEFSSLLFVPSARPFDFFSKQERESRVQLFVRRMFITEEAELLPPWLRFVQGVVDTEDLPLNVSREMLQSTPVLSRIRKAVTSRMVSQLEALAKSAPGGTAGSGNRDGEEKKEAGEKPVWFGIWENFGPVLKEGIWEDAEYRQTLAKIALFRSTHGEGWVTLADYVSRMKPEQEAIYYLVGESEAAVQNSAQLEGFRARGVEALLLSDPVDSFWPERLHAFAGKPLKSVLESGEDLEKFGLKESEGRLESRNLDRLLAVLKKALGEEVKDVRATDRLTDSPLLLSQEGGPDLAMQRLLRRSGQPIPPVPPVMELNPRHPLLHALADRADRGEEEDLKEYGRVLLDLGRLQEGEPLRDPSGFARVLAGLLAGSAGKDDAPVKKSKKKAD